MVKCFVCRLKYKLFSDVSFHRFPRNESKRQEWCGSLGIKCDSKKPGPNDKVCSNHFEIGDFLTPVKIYGHRVLIPNSVPKIRNTSMSASAPRNDVSASVASTSRIIIEHPIMDTNPSTPETVGTNASTSIAYAEKLDVVNGESNIAFQQPGKKGLSIKPTTVDQVQVEHVSTVQRAKRQLNIAHNEQDSIRKKLRVAQRKYRPILKKSAGPFVIPKISPQFAATTVTINDFDKVCRICLTGDNLCPIQCTYVTNLKVADLLEFSVMLDLKNESLPQNICETCLNNLCKVFEFKKQSQDIEFMLKKLLEQSKAADVSVENNNFESKITLDDEGLIVDNDDDDDSLRRDITIDADPVCETDYPIVDEVLKYEQECVDVTDLDVVSDITLLDESSKLNADNTNVENNNSEPNTFVVNENIVNIFESNDCDKTEEQSETIRCGCCVYVSTSVEDIQRHYSECHKYIKCEVCDESMVHNNTFYQHLKTHSRPYGCIECSRKFSTHQSLKMHRLKHTGRRPHVCTICNKSFRLLENLRVHATVPHLKCETCSKCFTNQGHLTQHKATHTGERPHVCTLCGKSFATSKYLRIHTTRHTNEKEGPYVCTLCGKGVATSSYLRIHMARHTDKNSPPTLICSFCGKGFRCRDNLYVHERSHKNRKLFTCRYCGREFKNRNFFNAHVRKHTSSDQTDESAKTNESRDYVCEICGNAFKTKAILRSHTIFHGDRSIVCTECGKAFFTEQCLKNHMRIHTGEKPFACNFCNKSFAHRSARASHLKIHLGIRAYKCVVCHRSFVQKQQWKAHLRTHTGEKPYNCEHCGESYRWLGNLKRHTMTHTGERPHVCDVCGRGFLRQSHLKRHTLLHTEKKADVCDLCGKAFFNQGHFKKHRMEHEEAESGEEQEDEQIVT